MEIRLRTLLKKLRLYMRRLEIALVVMRIQLQFSAAGSSL